MKAWIVHDSQHGNGRLLAETLGKVFNKDGIDVKISHIKDISPEKVVADAPDLIIVGAAVRAFRTDPPPKKWIKGLHSELKKSNKKIKYGCTFLTHSLKQKWIKGKGNRFNSLLVTSHSIEKVYSDFIPGRVVEVEGPLYDNVLSDVKKHATKILEWIEN